MPARENPRSAIRSFTCPGCGETFTGRYKTTRRFCSNECQATNAPACGKAAPDVILACEWCGEGFPARPYEATGTRTVKPRRFCSVACADAWQGRNKTEHVCETCGGAFRWSPSRTASGAYNIRYCSIPCRDADPARRARLLVMNIGQQRGHRTRPEAIGYGILDALGVFYHAQELVGGKFTVDALVPLKGGGGVVVQWDGDYWHGNPARFPEPDARQRKRMRLDASQDAYMRACGFTVLRFWESDLHSDPAAIQHELQARLADAVPSPASRRLDPAVA